MARQYVLRVKSLTDLPKALATRFSTAARSSRRDRIWGRGANPSPSSRKWEVGLLIPVAPHGDGVLIEVIYARQAGQDDNFCSSSTTGWTEPCGVSKANGMGSRSSDAVASGTFLSGQGQNVGRGLAR